MDSVARLEKFRDKYDIKFPFVSDTSRSIGSMYGTLKGDLTSSHERDTFLIGSDVTIFLAYQRVVAKGHAALVLADVRQLAETGGL